VLPEGVEKVKHRSDTAGYQHDLLRYCEKGDNDRFGRIEFAIGCNVTRAFKIAVTEVPGSEWQPIYKDYTEKKQMPKFAQVLLLGQEIILKTSA